MLVEQCQMALWVFLMAHCVWLVFAIQLVLKNQCFFLFFSYLSYQCTMLIQTVLIKDKENLGLE